MLLGRAENVLAELVPEHARLADVLQVVDVARETGGMVLKVLLTSDLDEAVGFFAAPEGG